MLLSGNKTGVSVGFVAYHSSILNNLYQASSVVIRPIIKHILPVTKNLVIFVVILSSYAEVSAEPILVNQSSAIENPKLSLKKIKSMPINPNATSEPPLSKLSFLYYI